MRRLTKATIYIFVIAFAALFVIYVGRDPAHRLKDMERVGPFDESAAPVKRLSDIHDKMTLQVAVDGKIVPMGLEDYVLGVVAAEMPASFEPEALKAQAVAARTFAVRRVLYGGCSQYPGADVCDQSSHCQAYCTLEEMKDKWKNGFDTYYARIEQAVAETAGKIVTYRGEPILMLYHASSAGFTESVENVFSQSLPYLRSVPSPDGEVTDLEKKEEYGRAWFCEAVNKAWPKAGLSAESLEKQVSVASRFQSGRADAVKLGGATVEATELRKLIGLRSTNFTVSYTQSSIVFTTEGNGHGVGMSQYGAQALAKQGKNYMEILKYYYTGVEVAEMK